MDTIAFKSEHRYAGVLSNLATLHMSWKGKTFTSSEAVYHWEKALFHGLVDIAATMERVTTGADAKRVSYRSAAPAWHGVKFDIMYAIMKEKFKQCPEYRTFIRPNTRYIEDTRDPCWGRGPRGDGFNAMGRIHERIAANSNRILILGGSQTDLPKRLQEKVALVSQKLVNVECRAHTFAESSELDIHAPSLQHFTYIFIMTDTCDKEEACTTITNINTLQSTLQQKTRANVFSVNVMPSSDKKHNQTAHYINRHLTNNIACKGLWKQSRGRRFQNDAHVCNGQLARSGVDVIVDCMTKVLMN